MLNPPTKNGIHKHAAVCAQRSFGTPTIFILSYVNFLWEFIFLLWHHFIQFSLTVPFIQISFTFSPNYAVTPKAQFTFNQFCECVYILFKYSMGGKKSYWTHGLGQTERRRRVEAVQRIY